MAAVFVCAKCPLMADSSQLSDLARLDGLIVSCRPTTDLGVF